MAGTARGRAWVALPLALGAALALLAAVPGHAHDTVVPHHLEDVEDLTHARNVRGLALVITIGFVLVLATVVVLAMRYAPDGADTPALREEQERLKSALLVAAEAARACLGATDEELATALATAYGRSAGRDARADVTALFGDGQAFGEDTLTARRSHAGEGVELCAATRTAGARVLFAGDGSYSVTVFAVAAQGGAEEGSGT